MATVYTWTGNNEAAAVQVAAGMAGKSVNVADMIPGSAPDGFPAFATSAPVMSTECGQKLTQFSAILAYFGGSCYKTAEWVAFAENVVKPAAAAWVFPTLGAMPNNKGEVAKGKAALIAALESLNDCLSTKTFLVGERATIADVAVVASLNLAFRQVLAPDYRKSIPHVVRWYQTCINSSAFKAFGAQPLCEKEAQFDKDVFGQLNKKGAGDNKKQAKKQEPKKKAEKKVEKKPEACPVAAAQAKKKDPWDGLGGKMDMDAWKRCYSNNDTIPVAMNYFWEHFDAENYSCWFGKYKYGNEISMPFMAANLIRGMYQRMGKMCKHSFGNVAVLKDENDCFEISGVFFWKGQGLAFELCDDWTVDYDGYDWRKLDVTNEADKNTITEYFAWGEGCKNPFPGKKFLEAKTWK